MIRKAEKTDAAVLAELAIQMWNEHTVAELADEFESCLQNDNSACFIKYIDGRPAGFAQCGLRTDYVEGADTTPVVYLEGIFILKSTGTEVTRGSFSRRVKTGRREWAARNLRATAS